MFPDIYKSKIKFLIALVFLAGFSAAFAQLTDIANKPIAGAATVDVKPNIMLLMDTSQSMSFSHMPDEVEGLQVDLPIGYKSYQCNALYYNPNTVYILPKNSLGVNLGTPSFTSARHNYYSTTDTATVDLSTAFRAYDTTTRQNQSSTANDTAQPAYYYIYTGTVTPLSYKTDPCTQTDTGVSGFSGNIAATGGNWTRKIVSATSGINSTDERVNFAIWYTYYRTRMAMTKSSLSRAFVTVTDSFRVGFVSANPGAPVAAAKYQALNDFNPTNKAAWYTKVFAQEPSGSSPMREGLARVGRHYGGMMDGINSGMTPDPVSYSCQKNFTLMTTDGYWNTVAETAGPVKLDGTTLVGKQDSVLTVNANWVPRPIWDGGSTSIRTTTDKNNTYSSLACVGAYENKTTTQITQVNSQVTQLTTQPLKSTTQNLQTTKQTTKTINQALASTTQPKQTTSQTSLATSQILKSTSATTQTVSYYQQYTTTWSATQTTVSKSTTQTTASYAQVQQSTTQKTQAQTQLNQTTTQTTQTVTQALQSTSQVTQSTSRTTASTTQNLVSTTRQDQTVSKVYKSTSQLNSYNGLTELQTPVATCTAGGSISCITVTTPSTLVASCVAAAADSTNAYTTTTCSTTIVSGPTPVATCTPVAATSANGYQSTTCTTVATGPTPAATCSAISPAAGNSYTTTSCTTNNTGATPVASCTAATASSGNNYTTTTCTPINTGPTVVSTCSSVSPVAGNNYTTTSCGASTTGPTPVASCTPSGPTNGLTTTCSSGGSVTVGVQTCTPQTGGSTNSWITITCNTVTTGPTPVASCTAQTAASGNSWKGITCATKTISAATPVQTCTAVTASSTNQYTATVCANGPLYVAAGTYVQTCTAATATSPNWAATTCTPVVTASTPVSSCTATAATSANSWKTTKCSTIKTGPTLVVQGGCTAATAASGNSWTTTACTTATVSGPTTSAACVNTSNTATYVLTPASATNGYVTTTCSSTSTTASPVQTCTPGSTTSGAVVTTCQKIGPTTTAVASCTPASPTSANSWRTITCNTTTATDVPAASCTVAAAGSGNSYVATTNCRTVTTTAVVNPTTCTASTASSTNSYVTTTCPVTTNGPTAVQVCTPVTAAVGNNWTTTTCTAATTGPTAVQTCAPITGTSANSWVTTTCSSSTDTGTTYVASNNCTSQTAASGNSWKTITCSTATLTSNVPVATCTASTTGSPNYIETTCPTPITTGPTAVASCTAQAASAPNYITTTCGTNTVGPTAVLPSSCLVDTTTTPGTPIAKTTTVGSPTFITTTCTPMVTSTLVASCTPASPISGNSYITTACSTDSTGPTQVSAASCTDEAATSANNYVATTCTPLPAHKIQYQTATSQLVEYISNTTLVKTDPLTTTTTAITDLDGVCYTDGVDTLPAQPAKPAPPTGCAAWPCVVTVDTAVGGSANSLADVAQYYYVTDLRPDMSNDVKATGTGLEDDTAIHQHMTTFGLGLGVAGTIDYQSNYKTALTGAFANIRTGTQNWPAWPDLSVDYTNALNYNNTKSIDDFWHAAVNGRGEYFSAGDPQAVVDGLSAALAKINTVAGSGGAATPANNTPVAGDNASFLTSFITQEWTGDLQSRAIDLSTGEVTTTVSWSARDKLDSMAGAACDNRVIYIRKTTATNNLGKFTWNTQACDSNGLPTGALDTGLNATEQAYFGSTTVANFTQYAAMSDGSSGTANQRSLAAGANLVNFIRGQRGLEGFTANSATKLYRARSHILGDIVGSVAKFVKAPSSTYSDTGYAAFKTSQASRTPMIYVGSNGGMLHAFYAPISASDPQAANAGKEAWAYIPQPVLPDLYRLADNDYKSNHHFYVDGSPTSGDVYDTTAGAWKTILVGGLNAGGKGYYALDITNPTTPKSLWEFNFSTTCGGTGVDCNLGLTFGRPVISKLANGTWVVFVTSGYNNVGSSTGSGDGVGYLYVLNAVTGSVISKISTGVGTSTNPSGLREVNNYVANGAVDNKTLRVYGGDLLGNVWRFDVNDTIAPAGKEATLVGITKDSLGATQPITTRVQLAEVDGKTMIVAATGKFLGSSDAATTQTQSIYGFKDTPGASVVYSNLRNSLRPMALTQTTASNGSIIRTVACTGSTTACALSAGWVIDLPESKERINVDPLIVSGTVVFTSNVPSNSACQAGGHSWFNYVSLVSGGVVSTSSFSSASSQLNDSLSVGLSFVILENKCLNPSLCDISGGGGRGDTAEAIVVGSDASVSTREIPIAPPDPMGRRVSWREIKR